MRIRPLLQIGIVLLSACSDLPSVSSFARAADPRSKRGTFDGRDTHRPQLPVRLCPVITEVDQPTDIQPLPDQPGSIAVLQKTGKAQVYSLETGKPIDTLLQLTVPTRSEQGLLGLAFHPDFTQSRRFFVHYSAKDRAGQSINRVSEWTAHPRGTIWQVEGERVILEVAQPYANHNAGQLAFGPDGFLYVGLGDGGSGGDPLDHGQNATTLLGSMLRIDVDQQAAGRPYAVPPDNPHVGNTRQIPEEIWAIGLRNPWRYTFDPAGRLIVADVGQNAFEEINIVRAGDNLGWNRREGRHCYPTKTPCSARGMVDPIYEYKHSADGRSVTGGVVYTGSAIPALHDRYIFGDFVSGRLWALELPPPGADGGQSAEPIALGRWALRPTSFALDPDGEVLVADFNGAIYRICPA